MEYWETGRGGLGWVFGKVMSDIQAFLISIRQRCLN